MSIPSFQHFKDVLPLPLAHKVADKRSADRLMGGVLCASHCFPPAFFKIISLTCATLITICLGVGLGSSHLELSGIPGPDVCFLFQLREFFRHYFFKYVFLTILSSPSGVLIMQMLMCLMLSNESSKLSSVFFVLFFPALWMRSTSCL